MSDLFERLIQEVVHGEDLAICDGQSVEGRKDGGPLQRRRAGIGLLEVGAFEGDLPHAASIAEVVAATIGENSVQPGAEAAIVPQPREIEPG